MKFYNFATQQVTTVATLPSKPVYGPSGLAISPDGRWLLYVQEDLSTSDLMLVENFH